MNTVYNITFNLRPQMIKTVRLMSDIANELNKQFSLNYLTDTEKDLNDLVFTLNEHASEIEYLDEVTLISNDELTYTMLGGTFNMNVLNRSIDRNKYNDGVYINNLTISTSQPNGEKFNKVTSIIDDVINNIKKERK